MTFTAEALQPFTNGAMWIWSAEGLWMTEDDTAQVQALKENGREDRTKRNFSEWGRQGYISNDVKKCAWVQEMWQKYRNNIPPGPNGQKTPPAESTWK